MFVLANTESVEMQKSAEGSASLCLLLLTFERRMWIVRFPSCSEQDRAQNERPLLIILCSLLWRLTALCMAVVESNIIILLEKFVFQQSRLLETAKLLWHLNLS